MGGPHVKQTENDDGEIFTEELAADATYIDRDKKEYPATVIREYEIPVLIDRGEKKETVKRKVADLRVNFGKPKRPDWKTVTGISRYEENFTNYKKPYFTDKPVEASKPEPKPKKTVETLKPKPKPTKAETEPKAKTETDAPPTTDTK